MAMQLLATSNHRFLDHAACRFAPAKRLLNYDYNTQIGTKVSALSDAPPIKPPSISG